MRVNKVWLCVLVFICATQTALCCSCTESSTNRPRTEAIRDNFYGSSMVYTARVVGATCNCVTNTTQSCINYNYTESTGPSAEVIAMGECEGARFSGAVTMCANLNEALGLSENIDVMPGTNLPTVNLTAQATFGTCPNVCPFSTEDPDNYELSNNPCLYTVEVLEVFKPFIYIGARRLTVAGPDVLTSCGEYRRKLNINETYLVGVGGACNPIPQWSTLDSYSSSELSLLRDLRVADGATTSVTDESTTICIECGAMASVPSLLTLLSMLFILVATS